MILKELSKASDNFCEIWGCFGFDRELETLSISVCVAPIYIKSGKKIDANSDVIGATDVALAA